MRGTLSRIFEEPKVELDWSLVRNDYHYNLQLGVIYARSMSMLGLAEGNLKNGIVRKPSEGGPSASNFLRPRSV